MTTVVPNWCSFCKHYTGSLKCRAFPSGIPLDITLGDPHSSPVSGQDNDLVFALDMRKQAAFDDVQPYLSTAVESVG